MSKKKTEGQGRENGWKKKYRRRNGVKKKINIFNRRKMKEIEKRDLKKERLERKEGKTK